MFQWKKMVFDTFLLSPYLNSLGAMVHKWEPNIIFDVINTLLEVETPIRLEIIYVNTNDYGKWI